jgi:CDP-glucose 4,6-dehydratase
MMPFHNTYQGKRVLVTGHTGFKGSWLCEWLLALGAEVTGYALLPSTTPALFDQLNLAKRLRHVLGDVRDLVAVRRVVEEVKPEFVFHLAAQPLVRLSYEQPVDTYATNVMGTVNVLEAIRLARCACSVIMVTTDKCYENKEWVHSYREEDPMGGYDPYSSSKGAAELIIAAYRRSFFSGRNNEVMLASARAGNVIGGGDWALDRIIPDCIRALHQKRAIPVRNKSATRPWQHVLEPLSGYLWLGACLANPRLSPIDANLPRISSQQDIDFRLSRLTSQLTAPFNFGPPLNSNRTVGELVRELLKYWPGELVEKSDPNAPHEAERLNLSIDKAHALLGWAPTLPFERTLQTTAEWYRHVLSGASCARDVTMSQTQEYIQAACEQRQVWTF